MTWWWIILSFGAVSLGMSAWIARPLVWAVLFEPRRPTVEDIARMRLNDQMQSAYGDVPNVEKIDV